MKSTSAGAEPNAGNQKNIIRFEDGIYGFESVKEFVLLQQDETQAIWSLQAADSPYPSLIVIDPFLIFPDYGPVLSPADLEHLGNPRKEDLCILAVAVIKRELKDSVVNLKSPVAINVPGKTGRQVILEDSSYPIRCKLFRSGTAGRD
ncbi:flagellar assembly protein FliW [Caproicibacter sp. BJN0012]|uniref:flagellar assembly protein FliW n=1 Tax=Caproicibacter sp. BJN0012 TaxID=3110227 RepID=UPI002E0D52C2